MEIILGFIIGPNGLHVVTPSAEVKFLSDFGFSYLMFLSGIELDFDLILKKPKSGERSPWAKGVLFFATTLVISIVVATLLFKLNIIKNVILVSLILSATSIGIVTPTLKAKGWLVLPIGQEALLYALMADLVTLVLFTGYIAIHSSGSALSVLSILGLLFIFLIIYRSVKRLHGHKIFHYVENATSEFGLRASIALVLVFLVFSQELGVATVMGAFLAGTIISLLSEKHSVLTQKLNSLGYGFLLPIFFVDVGLNFQVGALKPNWIFWLTLALLFLTMYVNTFIPTFLFVKHVTPHEKIAIGFLLSSRLSLTIVASQIGQQLKILSPELANELILLAVLSCLLSPIVFNHFSKGTKNVLALVKQKITIETDSLPEGWIIEQLEVKNPWVAGKRIRSLRIPDDLLIVSIIRSGDVIVPKGYTSIEQFDVFQVLGNPTHIALLESELM